MNPDGNDIKDYHSVTILCYTKSDVNRDTKRNGGIQSENDRQSDVLKQRLIDHY